jgi:hypothetical protein
MSRGSSGCAPGSESIILEIAARTRFVGAFTHVSERTAPAEDLDLSLLRGIARRGLQYRPQATHPQQPTSPVSRSTLLRQSKLIARRDLYQPSTIMRTALRRTSFRV